MSNRKTIVQESCPSLQCHLQIRAIPQPEIVSVTHKAYRSIAYQSAACSQHDERPVAVAGYRRMFVILQRCRTLTNRLSAPHVSHGNSHFVLQQEAVTLLETLVLPEDIPADPAHSIHSHGSYSLH
jgi:hypothetical protein